MNIKQVEQLTGITSKNIRFYEDSGLLHPHRNENNGYREYTDEDVRHVKLIKMLRKLNLRVETIREILSGQQSLDTVMSQQYACLEQSIRQMEAAKQICKALGNEQAGIGNLDVDMYLDKIETLENQGEWFSDILDDFKQVVAAVEKRRITIVPDDLVTTPREFTDALLKYAKDYNRDITITKEGMQPHFTLDGLPYHAMWVSGRAQFIFAYIDDPTLLVTPDVAPTRRRWIELVWKYIFPVGFWGLILLLVIRSWFI